MSEGEGGKQLFVWIHTKWNRFYCLHPYLQYVPLWHPPSSSCLSSPIRRAHTCTCSTFTQKRWLLLGLVFDDMLSECLISQCFDLLQLLDRSLVRAWIWHTLPIITWRALYSVFLLLLLPLFPFETTSSTVVLQFCYGYFTLMKRLYSKAFVEFKTTTCYILQRADGYYWPVITFLSFFCTESTVWLQPTLWIFH